ncbi:hypothetical protein MPH_07251 [Macrophomina phaseolina MS6]|uniref:Uncharacterized protein n=1 Tax=Macrophomina phaseolina (strain MS6) TaxID=1126212 RepID=K2QZS4_MACPH|nr:hypothetical protein MPH_07251 [Macrophomina phaseolina MS6]
MQTSAPDLFTHDSLPDSSHFRSWILFGQSPLSKLGLAPLTLQFITPAVPGPSSSTVSAQQTDPRCPRRTTPWPTRRVCASCAPTPASTHAAAATLPNAHTNAVTAIIGRAHLPGYQSIAMDSALDRKLPDILLLVHRDLFRIDGSKLSQSILPLVQQPGMKHKEWKGPVVGFVKPKRDVTMTDFHHIVVYLRSYSYRITTDVKGVRINCLGDLKCHGRRRFEPVDVPLTHPIFSSHDTSDIADRLEIPILTRREPHSAAWKHAKDLATFGGLPPGYNLPASSLHLSTSNNKASGRSWGKVPSSWMGGIGSVLVVRRDKMPLHRLHVDALTSFCTFNMESLMGYALYSKPEEKPMSRDFALQHASPPMFCLHWRNFIKLYNSMPNEAIRHEKKPNGLPLLWPPYEDPVETMREMEEMIERLSSS